MNINVYQVNKIFKEFLAQDDEDCARADLHGNGTPFGNCTNCVEWVRDHYFENGIIMGYQIEDNPNAIIGKDCDGHDVLIVDGKYLIDFWARGINGIEKAPIMLDIERDVNKVKKWYGDIEKFTTLDGIEFKHIKNY